MIILHEFLKKTLNDCIEIKQKVTGIYVQIPANTSFPYIYIGNFSSTNISTKNLIVNEISFSVNLYFRDKNIKMIIQMANKIKEVLGINNYSDIAYISYINEKLKLNNDGITQQLTLNFKAILVGGEKYV